MSTVVMATTAMITKISVCITFCHQYPKVKVIDQHLKVCKFVKNRTERGVDPHFQHGVHNDIIFVHALFGSMTFGSVGVQNESSLIPYHLTLRNFIREIIFIVCVILRPICFQQPQISTNKRKFVFCCVGICCMLVCAVSYYDSLDVQLICDSPFYCVCLKCFFLVCLFLLFFFLLLITETFVCFSSADITQQGASQQREREKEKKTRMDRGFMVKLDKRKLFIEIYLSKTHDCVCDVIDSNFHKKV